ncbi:MAG: hypothetical protein J7M26_06205 [Armatimonadetes bacterium]|nr:hypothetical protein [Armatimonadota bacterium]
MSIPSDVPEFQEEERRALVARARAHLEELDRLQQRLASFDAWAEAERQRLKDRVATLAGQLAELGAQAKQSGLSKQFVASVTSARQTLQRLVS